MRTIEDASRAFLESGDAGAFEEIVHRLGPFVYGLANAVLQDQDLAQDAAQETFLALWKARSDPGQR